MPSIPVPSLRLRLLSVGLSILVGIAGCRQISPSTPLVDRVLPEAPAAVRAASPSDDDESQADDAVEATPEKSPSEKPIPTRPVRVQSSADEIRLPRFHWTRSFGRAARSSFDRWLDDPPEAIGAPVAPDGARLGLISPIDCARPDAFAFDAGDAERTEFDHGDDPMAMPRDEFACDDDPPRISFRDDLYDLLPTLGNDALACVTWTNAIVLGIAAGGAVAIREHLDGDVRDYTARHRLLWGEGSEVLRQFGEFSWQVPAIATVYVWSVWGQREREHEFSKAVISAYAITAFTTVAIKGVTDTHRPTNEFQDGKYGFPSYHTASTFAIAAVADEYYGWPVGLPCYVLAGLVGWSRIDQREHDFSDVIFGSVLGFVIGKSVAACHLDGCTGCRIIPCYDPATGFLGATFHKRF